MAKVLCVEDDPMWQEILAESLIEIGFEVELAGNASEGLEKAFAWLPDVITMDAHLGHELENMDGLDAIITLRQNEITANIPIIIISGEIGKRDVIRFAKIPTVIDILLKEHFEYDTYRSAIWQCLNKVQRIKFPDAEREATYSENMELKYQLKLWKNTPELAATLENLTNFTGSSIHDLRNRLGIVKNYVPKAKYSLQLVNSLAFLRFKPSLSLQVNDFMLEKPVILDRDLGVFEEESGLHFLSKIMTPKPVDFASISIDFWYSLRSRTSSDPPTGITARGLVDVKTLSLAVWFLLQGIAVQLAQYRTSQQVSPERHNMDIEDKRVSNPASPLHINADSALRQGAVLPYGLEYNNVLTGDQMATCFLVLEKAVFLNNGSLAVNETGDLEIKIPFVSTDEISNLETLQSSNAELTKEISNLIRQYNGPKPDIFPLIKGFVAAISHEIDNIIMEAQEQADEKTHQVIYRNCRYAQLLLQNLLWFGAGYELPKEAIDVGETLRSIREIMRSEIRERTDDDDEDDDFIEVKIEIQPDLSPLLANRVSLQQVFMNLIINALDAMPESGSLTLRAFQAGPEVHAEIGDTGGGISSEDIDRIFDLNFSTKPGKERGAGLHIVKSIVDELGGRIEVVSELGLGTTFRVCLQGS